MSTLEPDEETVYIPCGSTSSPRVYHTDLECYSLPDNPKGVPLSVAEWKDLHECSKCK